MLLHKDPVEHELLLELLQREVGKRSHAQCVRILLGVVLLNDLEVSLEHPLSVLLFRLGGVHSLELALEGGKLALQRELFRRKRDNEQEDEHALHFC